jgi:hypothetical protein
MKTRYWAVLLGLIFIGAMILLFRPVQIPEEKDLLSLKGTVTDIYEGGVKDVVFKLRGQDKIYYVNRGLERGLNLKELKAKLIDQEIVIKFPDHWTPLDPNRSSIHISKIEHEGRTLFTELD